MAVTDNLQKEDILFDLIDKSTAVLERDSGLDHEAAHEAACTIASEIAKDWGGMQIYFPKGLSLRDIKIYQEFTGNIQIQHFHQIDILDVLLRDLGYGDVVYVNLVLPDQVEQEVQRPFKCVDLYFIH